MVITAIDTAYYGALTFTPISFLRTNVLSGIAHFYGTNTFHYYLTQGLPIILGPALPFAVHGVWMHLSSSSIESARGRSSPTHNRGLSVLLGLVAWTSAVYSCLAHKEWRFIHPLLPIFHIFAADSLITLEKTAMVSPLSYLARLLFTHRFPPETLQTPIPSSDPKQPKRLVIRRNHLALLLGISIPLNLYLVRVHGSAQIIATRYLHSLGQDTSRVKSIGVLMPCHSIPWQSYLHLPHLEQEDTGSRLWALGCEPPLGLNRYGSDN
jgi:phosphatidylinositol glycan class B